MNFEHVMPRDLFNYGKLFKAMGQLSLLIHDGRVPEGLTLEIVETTTQFHVYLNHEYGGIYVGNVLLYYRGEAIFLYSPYNSRSAYPLEFVNDGGESQDVFDDNAQLSEDFKAYLQRLDREADWSASDNGKLPF